MALTLINVVFILLAVSFLVFTIGVFIDHDDLVSASISLMIAVATGFIISGLAIVLGQFL